MRKLKVSEIDKRLISLFFHSCGFDLKLVLDGRPQENAQDGNPSDSHRFNILLGSYRERENLNGNPVFFLGSKAEELELVSF